MRLDFFTNPESAWHVESHVSAVVLACVVALIVSLSFMDIFDVTTDTLLYCYAEDKRTHGAAIRAPSYMRELYEDAEARVKMKPESHERLRYSQVGKAGRYYTGH